MCSPTNKFLDRLGLGLLGLLGLLPHKQNNKFFLITTKTRASLQQH